MAEQKSVLACKGCGINIPSGKVKGRLKHPYCEKCFKKVWNDDEDAYLKWLDKLATIPVIEK